MMILSKYFFEECLGGWLVVLGGRWTVCVAVVDSY